MRAASAADLTIATSDFTIESFVRFGSVSGLQYILSQWGGANTNATKTWALRYTASALSFIYNFSNTVTSSSWTPVVGTIYHIALCRAAGQLRFFVNGVQLGSTVANTANIAVSSQFLRIGAEGDASNNDANTLNGRMDEVRITIGTGRYTANFAVPDEPFPRV